MKKYYQFALAIFSICLVFILGLSTVSKTIHNGLFHPEFSSNSSSHKGCSNHDSGPCRGDNPSQDSSSCDSSCPVNIFSSGILSLEYLEVPPTRSTHQSEYISFFFTSVTPYNHKRSLFARGPPLHS